MTIKMDDYNNKNVRKNKSIKLKSELDTKSKDKYRLRNKCISVISLFFAILVTVSVGTFIHEETKNMNYFFGHETILDEPELLHSLQAAQDRGVVIASHGWEHENYSELTPNEAVALLEKSGAIFEQAGLNSGMFISPYEITGVTEDDEVAEALRNAGFELKANERPINEYTWFWRDMTSFDDPRYQAALTQIETEKPKTVLFHVQDWNEYTEQFLINYVTSSTEKNITLRMDDVSVNSPTESISEAVELIQYDSVSEVVFAVIPSGIRSTDDPVIYNIRVNDIMEIYFLFFIMTALLPMSFFVIWKLLSSWNTRKYKDGQEPSKNNKYPNLVSVIVPAYNEEKSIGRCIEALLNQDYKGAMEIIVVNDGSSDRTAEIISKYPVKHINLEKNGGKANALNKGIEESKGDILVFTDSDSNMMKDAVRLLVKTFVEDSDAQMVTGNVLINNPEKSSLLRRMVIYFQMIEYHLEQEINRDLQGLYGKILVCPGPSTAVRRSVCEVVRFNDDTIVEDADFTVHVLKESMKVIRNPQAKVYTNAPETLSAWYKQRKRWWYGSLQVWRIHRRWAIGNMWMIYNYLGYIISVCTIIMILLVPYLMLQYNNLPATAFRGFLCILIPIALYIMLTGLFFGHNKKLLPMLIPYLIVYSSLRTIVASYVYIRYLTGMGLKIKFGSRMINAK